MSYIRRNLMTSTAIAAHAMADEGEPMDIIELEESLEDAEKPKELPPGTYKGEVQDVQAKVSDKGNTYYAIQFRIPPDELPADLQDQYEDGAVMFWNRTMKPKGPTDRRGIWGIKKLHIALGLSTNITTIDPNEWMGRECSLRVRSGNYQGETRAEIGSLEALSSGGNAPARGKQAAAPQKAAAARGKGRRAA